MACMELGKAVGKIIKLESFMLEKSFQILVYTWKIVQLETSFQYKTFQLDDLSKCPYQLHVSRGTIFKNQ